MSSWRLRSSELKRILCVILFQSFSDLTFIKLEPNIWVLVLAISSKYYCVPLALWLRSSLKGLKNWSKVSGWLLTRLWKTNRQFFRMILFFELLILNWLYKGSETSINCLKLIILKALFRARWIISNVSLWTCPRIWHAYLIWELKKT